MSWMAWTLPTAVFFIGIVGMLVTMTVVEIKFPSTMRKGFLPIATSRGDRVFIGLLGTAFIHLGWIAGGLTTIWPASVLCLVWIAILMRWG